MLFPTKTAEEELLEIVFPHDLLPRLLDWSASGWNIGARRKGLGPNDRLTFELQGFEAGRTEDGQLVLTMQFGENGSVSYKVSPDLAWAILEGLRTQLEPESAPTHSGTKH
jgi:hypothetical protein